MKKPAIARPARTPKEVLAPKVAPSPAAAAVAGKTDAQLSAGAKAWDEARTALEAAGKAAAEAQAAFDALPSDATDEQRHEAELRLDAAEEATIDAQAAIAELTNSDGTPSAAAPASLTTAGAAAAANAPATNSTHNPGGSDHGGAGNPAGPATGDAAHNAPSTNVLVVRAKRPSRWRAGRQFTREEARIPLIALTEAEFRAIQSDPVLESQIEGDGHQFAHKGEAAMPPTVGRIVHFYTRDTTKHFNGQGEGPYAAIVTQVSGPTMANLKVLPGFGEPYDAGSVSERDQAEGHNAWWVWPPRE